MGESSAGSYLADPTFPIPSHCAVIILFQSVPVHQLSRLALLRVKYVFFSISLFSKFSHVASLSKKKHYPPANHLSKCPISRS